jgi:hypothetical protein
MSRRNPEASSIELHPCPDHAARPAGVDRPRRRLSPAVRRPHLAADMAVAPLRRDVRDPHDAVTVARPPLVREVFTAITVAMEPLTRPAAAAGDAETSTSPSTPTERLAGVDLRRGVRLRAWCALLTASLMLAVFVAAFIWGR